MPRPVSKGSWYRNTPRKNWMVGLTYCISPRVASDTRRATEEIGRTIDTLGKEVEKSKGYIARAEGVAQAKLEAASSPFEAIESK